VAGTVLSWLVRTVTITASILLAGWAVTDATHTALAAPAWTVSAAAGASGQATSQQLSAPPAVTASCTLLTTPITVSWTAVAHASTYTVYQSTGAGSYTQVGTVSAPTTTWSYSPPPVLQTYSFEVAVTLSGTWTSPPSSPTLLITVTPALACA
jgi:hypothetical protein